MIEEVVEVSEANEIRRDPTRLTSNDQLEILPERLETDSLVSFPVELLMS